MNEVGPPPVAERILRKVLRSSLDADGVLGDLHEEWLERRSGGETALRAWVWYWLQVLVVAWSAIRTAPRSGGQGNVRLALRGLRRNPLYAITVMGGVTLAVALNATVVSIAEVVLFDPLPFPEPHRLTHLTSDHTGSETGGFGVSYLNATDLAARLSTAEEVALYMDWQDLTMTGGPDAVRVSVAFVDEAYLRLLGLRPRQGRMFAEEEYHPNAGGLFAIVGRGFWSETLGAPDRAVGTVLTLNGQPAEVVGVLEDDRGDLRYLWGQQPVDVFLPLMAAERLTPFDLRGDRGARVLNALLQTAPSSSLDQMRTELVSVSREHAASYPESNEGWSYNARSLSEAMFEGLREPARVLIAGSVLILFLVAVNLTTLSMIRGVARSNEAAVRRALGATEQQLFRIVAAEGVVACGLAAVIGLVASYLIVDLLAVSDVLALPSYADVRLTLRTVVGSLAVTTGLGVWLAWSQRRGQQSVVAAGGTVQRAESPRANITRDTLVTSEIALAFVLLVGAGLMLASFRALQDTEHGFDPTSLLMNRVDLTAEALETDRAVNFFDELSTAADNLNGVREAFVWSPNRLGNGNQVDLLTRVNRWDAHPAERVEASLHAVAPGTLGKLGIRMMVGRDFTRGDNENAAPVAIVSEALGRALWPDQDPIGNILETREAGDLLQATVVGVVADARHRTRLIDPFGPQRDVYYPFRQRPWNTMSLVLRLSDDADVATVTADVRALVRRLDPDIPVYGVNTMDAQRRSEEARLRVTATLVVAYAVVALLLASLGVYGVLAYAVRRRQRELGLRLALGATPGRVLTFVLRNGMRLVTLGVIIGIGVSLFGSRLVRGALYGVEPVNGAVYAFVAATLITIALVASLVPALRASRLPPTEALRVD